MSKWLRLNDFNYPKLGRYVITSQCPSPAITFSFRRAILGFLRSNVFGCINGTCRGQFLLSESISVCFPWCSYVFSFTMFVFSSAMFVLFYFWPSFFYFPINIPSPFPHFTLCTSWLFISAPQVQDASRCHTANGSFNFNCVCCFSCNDF